MEESVFDRRKQFKKVGILGNTRRNAETRSFRNSTNERERQRTVKRQLLCNDLKIRTTAPSVNDIESVIDKLVSFIQTHHAVLALEGTESSIQCLHLVQFPLHNAPDVMPLWVLTGDTPVLEENCSLAPILSPLLDLAEELHDIFAYISADDSNPHFLMSAEKLVGLKNVLFELWCSKQFQNSERSSVSSRYSIKLPLIVEKIVFKLLCAISNGIVFDYSQFTDTDYVLLMVGFLTEPISLRLAQIATLSLASIAEVSPQGFSISMSDTLCERVDFITEIVKKTGKMAVALQHAGETASRNFITTSPLGGSAGFLRVIMSLFNSLTKFRDLSICQIVLREGTLLPLMNMLISNFISQFFPSGNSHSRMALSEGLWVVANCLEACSAMYNLSDPNTCDWPEEIAVPFLERVWALAVKCLDFVSTAKKDIFCTSTEGSNYKDQFLKNDPEVVEKLNQRPSDLIVPSLLIIRLLCALELQHYDTLRKGGLTNNTQSTFCFPVLSRLVSLETANWTDENSLYELKYLSLQRLNGLIGRSILFGHTGIKHEGVTLLSVVAAGNSSHVEFVYTFFPILPRLLLDTTPYFIKRPAAVALNRISFSHGRRLLSSILAIKTIPTEKEITDLAVLVDPFSSVETQTSAFGFNEIEDTLSTANLSIPVVVHAVLSQFHRDQFDIPLLHVCLDFLDEVLEFDADVKLTLFHYGIVEIVESVQCIDNDTLFHRIIKFVERHFDDYDDQSQYI